MDKNLVLGFGLISVIIVALSWVGFVTRNLSLFELGLLLLGAAFLTAYAVANDRHE